MKHPILLISILFGSALNTFAQDGNNLYAAGNEEMRKGNYREAESLFQSAIAKEPFNWNLHTQLAICLHKQKRYTEADSIYEYVIVNDSAPYKAYWHRAYTLEKLGRDSMVVVCNKKFLLLTKGKDVNTISAYKNVGRAYERLLKSKGLFFAEVDDMLYHYERAAALDPGGPDTPTIENFIEVVKLKRPAKNNLRWKME